MIVERQRRFGVSAGGARRGDLGQCAGFAERLWATSTALFDNGVAPREENERSVHVGVYFDAPFAALSGTEYVACTRELMGLTLQSLAF